MINLSDTDWQQVTDQGISREEISLQYHRFTTGFPSIRLIRNLSPGDGVVRYSEEAEEEYIRTFEAESRDLEVTKFVPASGAASRMFRSLQAWMTDPGATLSGNPELSRFFNHLTKFAFYPELVSTLARSGLSPEQLLADGHHRKILAYLLTEKGLNYRSIPKALIRFHAYGSESWTAAEEHLVEAARYSLGKGNIARLHFTVSPAHRALMESHLAAAQETFAHHFGIRYEIGLSFQNQATQTLAMTLDNEPFRDESGALLLRPGGHGALLENLDGIDADIVFIKNIDNVVPDRLKGPVFRYKKLIGGVLLAVQKQVFDLLRQLEKPGAASDFELLDQAGNYLEKTLFVIPPPGYPQRPGPAKHAYLLDKLNRPIRVVGIIRTESPTGGGPFWVAGNDGTQMVQIAESPQIDTQSEDQARIASSASYANVTDLVCSLKDHHGNPFDLFRFRDEDTGFITQKSHNGRGLKAMELPGLWNGSMAGWNSVFVEVPQATFHPVKTVMDLLLPAHSPE